MKTLALLQAMRLRESAADHHLVRLTWHWQAPQAQMQRIEATATTIGYRHHQGAHRLGKTRHVHAHLGHHTGFDLVHASDRLHARQERLRCPLQAGKHLGKTVVAVIAVLGGPQRPERA